jgi:uncharacterized protein YecT (DUF1311 family)
MTRHLAIFCGLIFATGAAADPSLECSLAAGSQVEIGNCVAAVEKAVDQVMEQALGYVQASAADLDEITARAVSVPALEAGQAAWSAYRDAHCEFVGSTFGGGSGTGIAITSCRIELGRDRIEELMAYVQ